jgi:hypothetical protein
MKDVAPLLAEIVDVVYGGLEADLQTIRYFLNPKSQR